MNFSDMLRGSGSWVATKREPGPLISSRIRLARNLFGHRFPSWAGDDERQELWDTIQDVLKNIPVLQPSHLAHMDDLGDLDKQILFERHLISRDHMEQAVGSGVLVREDERVAILINEEDHLRLQALEGGLNLSEAWKTINRVDSEIEKQLRYAFSVRVGYLTACPSNVGTGMRASVMLHLPGLVLMNEIAPIVKGMGKIGLAVRGLWGEGTEATGNMFQISNQITLGEKESDIIQNLEQIVLEVVQHEKNARVRLAEERELLLKDQAGRAYGILSRAHILTSKEALDLLSDLRLGIDLGMVDGLDGLNMDELLLLIQPAHLQKIEGSELKPKERDRVRAELIREWISNPPRAARSERMSSE